MSIAATEALVRGIVRDFEELVKEVVAGAESGKGVRLEAIEERLRRAGRWWLGRMLSQVVEQLRGVAEEGVQCGCCGSVGRYKGEQWRSQETLVGKLRYRRGYYYCGECQRGWYPLDERLGVLAGQFSGGLSEAMALVGVELPFAAAARALERLAGVAASASAIERLTEERGAVLEGRRGEEEKQLMRQQPIGPAPRPVELGQWVVGLDATMTHFDDGWHEVKVGVVCLARVHSRQALEPEVRVEGQSYISHVGGIEEAGAKLYCEALRRGVRPESQTLVCLADGAPGNWNQFALHFPYRVEILDWYHAMEHLWAAGKAGLGEGKPETTIWVKAQETLLWQGKPQAVIAAIEALAVQSGAEALRRELNYFRTNQERLDYARYRACGYPIGSGMVESACKQVVGARLKGAGMCWSKPGAQAVLTLRCSLTSNRWSQDWQLTAPLPMAA